MREDSHGGSRLRSRRDGYRTGAQSSSVASSWPTVVDLLSLICRARDKQTRRNGRVVLVVVHWRCWRMEASEGSGGDKGVCVRRDRSERRWVEVCSGKKKTRRRCALLNLDVDARGKERGEVVTAHMTTMWEIAVRRNPLPTSLLAGVREPSYSRKQRQSLTVTLTSISSWEV